MAHLSAGHGLFIVDPFCFHIMSAVRMSHLSMAHISAGHVPFVFRCGYWSSRKPLISVAPTGSKLLLRPNPNVTEYELPAGPIATLCFAYHK